jgi:hypothetical protein
MGEEVLAGTFFLNERPIIILFDSGAPPVLRERSYHLWHQKRHM